MSVCKVGCCVTTLIFVLLSSKLIYANINVDMTNSDVGV